MSKERKGHLLRKAESRSQIVYRSPHVLLPCSRNSRVHSPKQIARISQSIKRFGFLGVVLVDAKGTIIAGHARVLGSIQAGLTSVPTICVDHLSDAEQRAFVIADNQLSDLSSFDVEILGAELTEIGLLDPDFDLTLTGLDEELIEIYQDGTAARSRDQEAEVLPVQEGAPVCQLGDLWLLGDHKLLCGDATKVVSYRALMSQGKARLIISDVPYNLPIPGFVSGNGKVKHHNFMQASGELSVQQFTQFLIEALNLFQKFSSNGSLHYIFIDHRHLFELISAGRTVYDAQLNLIVWAKSQGGMGSFYRSQHELILLFKKGKAAHVNNILLGKHGRTRTNVWSYPGANSFSAHREEELGWHSTVKPLALVADAIIDASRPGDIVLDGFGGSGTTLMAAEQTGRRARLIELDAGYCDVTLRRFIKYTGAMPILAESGKTFASLEANGRGEAVMDDDDFLGPINRGQFKKGKSGNPKGRPRGSKGMKTIVLEAAQRKVSVTMAGRRRKVSALEAIIATMRSDALRGDRHARQDFLRMCDRYAVGELEQVARATLTDGEKELLAGILGRTLPGQDQEDG